jgi:hypothetical protein
MPKFAAVAECWYAIVIRMGPMPPLLELEFHH